jgi:SAM-dependent methyltransferase
VQAAPRLPEAPPPYDSSRLAELNAAWNILPATPAFDQSIKGRIGRLVWRLVGPPIETQQRFNAALVDHLNRNARAHEQTSRSQTALIEALGEQLAALARFESLLIQFLQTITVYVDSKDRSLGGSELRERLGLTEQRLQALKRVIERAAPAPASAPGASTPTAAPFSGEVDSLTYVGFEDRFRGTQDDIRRRVEDYVPLLAAADDIVDIGCGRGELLALLAARGVRARGVDVNAAMVALCQEKGLQAELGDGLSFLERQPDASIGGLIAVQVVEHLSPAYLTAFLAAAFHKMRPGAPLVLETINPSCWMAFFETYIRDLTHQHPLHPDTLKYLVHAAGFSQVDAQFRSPVSTADRLVAASAPGATEDPGLGRVIAAINDHAEKLNRRLFSFMDYVVLAKR